MNDAGPSRRALLTAGGLLAVASCTVGGDQPPAPSPRPAADQDQLLRDEIAADVRRLAGEYAAAMAAHPGLRARLAPLAAEHEAHLRALQPGAATSSSGPPSSGPPSSGPPSSGPSSSGPSSSPLDAPPGPAGARLALAREERAAAAVRIGQAEAASSGLARLIASIGACEAAHAALLGAGS